MSAASTAYLDEHLARYYRYAEGWEAYEAQLVQDASLGPLWDEVDAFPQWWDMSSITGKIRATRDDRKGYDWRPLEKVFGMFRRSVRSQRLADIFFKELGAGHFAFIAPYSAYGDREQIASDIAATVRHCQELGLHIPKGTETVVAKLVVESQYEDTQISPTWVTRRLSWNPDLFSYGYFPPGHKVWWASYAREDDLTDIGAVHGFITQEICDAFNTAATAYELAWASQPDQARLHALLATGVVPTSVASLAAYQRPIPVFFSVTRTDLHAFPHLHKDFYRIVREKGGQPIGLDDTHITTGNNWRQYWDEPSKSCDVCVALFTAESSMFEQAEVAAFRDKPILLLYLSGLPPTLSDRSAIRLHNMDEFAQALEENLDELLLPVRTMRQSHYLTMLQTIIAE